MYSSIALWGRPYWDLMDYGLSATWDSGDGTPLIRVHKAGTLALPGDADVEDMLVALGTLVKQQRAARSSPWDVTGG